MRRRSIAARRRLAAASNTFEASHFLRARVNATGSMTGGVDSTELGRTGRSTGSGAAPRRSRGGRSLAAGRHAQPVRRVAQSGPEVQIEPCRDARNRIRRDPRCLQLADDCRADGAVRVAVGTDVQVCRRDRYEDREGERTKSDDRSPQRRPSTLSEPRRYQVVVVPALQTSGDGRSSSDRSHRRCPIWMRGSEQHTIVSQNLQRVVRNHFRRRVYAHGP